MSLIPALAQKPPVTRLPSYVSLDANGSAMGSSESPCTRSRCANGLRFHWSGRTCFDGDRYPSVVLVWTFNGGVLTDHWPIVAPCSTGLRFSWGKGNILSKANWLHTGDPTTDFRRFGKQWQQPNGLALFFQGGDSPTSVEWLENGKSAGSIPIPVSVDDVHWSGYPPPASNPAAPATSAARGISAAGTPTPDVVLLGRTANLEDATTTSVAPALANGVDFAWYLPLNQKYDEFRGCIEVGGTWWAAPPVAYAYTTDGQLNSQATVLKCPVNKKGLPLHFNHLNFSWSPAPDGSGEVLSKVRAAFNNGAKVSWLPQRLIPQPPPGTNGLQFGFHHDDYQASAWTADGFILAPISPPAHTRMSMWHG